MYYWAQWILTEFTIVFPLTGVPVSSRVSTKIQQLLSTLKRPKRPPLKEFFVDDSEEIVEGSSESARSTHSLAASARWMGVVKAWFLLQEFTRLCCFPQDHLCVRSRRRDGDREDWELRAILVSVVFVLSHWVRRRMVCVPVRECASMCGDQSATSESCFSPIMQVLGQQVWWQTPLFAEPSHSPRNTWFL